MKMISLLTCILLLIALGCSSVSKQLPPCTDALLSIHYQREVPFLASEYLRIGNRFGPGVEFHANHTVIVFPKEGRPKFLVLEPTRFEELLHEWDRISLMQFDETLFDYHRPPPPDAIFLGFDNRALVIVERRNVKERALGISFPRSFSGKFHSTAEGRALTKAIEFTQKVSELHIGPIK